MWQAKDIWRPSAEALQQKDLVANVIIATNSATCRQTVGSRNLATNNILDKGKVKLRAISASKLGITQLSARATSTDCNQDTTTKLGTRETGTTGLRLFKMNLQFTYQFLLNFAASATVSCLFVFSCFSCFFFIFRITHIYAPPSPP